MRKQNMKNIGLYRIVYMKVILTAFLLWSNNFLAAKSEARKAHSIV